MNPLSICILHSKILARTVISGCIALHGFGWMHVYFQVGMIIGDTEQHNKIFGASVEEMAYIGST